MADEELRKKLEGSLSDVHIKLKSGKWKPEFPEDKMNDVEKLLDEIKKLLNKGKESSKMGEIVIITEENKAKVRELDWGKIETLVIGYTNIEDKLEIKITGSSKLKNLLILFSTFKGDFSIHGDGGKYLDGFVLFERNKFYGDFRLEKITFKLPVSFWRDDFYGIAKIKNCVFEQGVNFYGSNFFYDANFIGSVFRKILILENVDFRQRIYFEDPKEREGSRAFVENLDLSNTYVNLPVELEIEEGNVQPETLERLYLLKLLGYEGIGDRERADKAFENYMKYHLDSLIKNEESSWKKWEYRFYKAVGKFFGFGNRFLIPLLVWLLLVFLVFPLLYFSLDLFSHTIFDSATGVLDRLRDSYFLSLASATTLDYDGLFKLKTVGYIFGALEAILSVGLWTLIFASLVRKITR